jgi:branched-chain amino acid transport system substrate-binding protein
MSCRSRIIPPAAALLAFALVPALPGCGARVPGFGAAAADTAYVGVAVGLQNPERYANVFRGVELALDELNARRPADAPVLALRRPSAEAKSHVEIAAAFRDDPAVIGVVGHTESEPTMSAAPVYEDRENGGRRALVAVSPTASGTLVARSSEWVFRVCPVVDQQARAVARYLVDSLSISRAAVVYRSDASGKGFLRGFAGELEARGGSVLERDPFVEEIPEFEAYARRIARKDAGAVVFSGNAADLLKMARELRGAGGTARLLATNPPTPEMMADPASAAALAGMRYTALYLPDRPLTDAARAFAPAFQQRFGAAPDHWAALAYDAATLIGAAVHRAGPDRRRVRDEVAKVGRGLPPHSGATGEIRFDQWGDPVEKPVLLAEVGR